MSTATRFTVLVPALSDTQFAALKADIAERGVLVPLVEDEFGAMIDGGHRLRAVEELRAEGVDVEEPRREIRQGLTDAEKRSMARAINLARRHMTQDQIRALIEQQLAETPQKSSREIAAELKVSPTTVADVRSKCAPVQSGHLNTGSDGKSYPASPTVAEERRQRVAEEIERRPDASNREIAKAVGVAPNTVAAVKARPLIVDTPKQLERVRALAEAGKLSLVDQRGSVDSAHRAMRMEKKTATVLERQAAEREQSTATFWPDGRFSVIYADPPWKYNDRRNTHTRFCGGASSEARTGGSIRWMGASQRDGTPGRTAWRAVTIRVTSRESHAGMPGHDRPRPAMTGPPSCATPRRRVSELREC